jgi:chromate transporter
MHSELVDKKRWIGEGRFLHALNYCMLLPGPEAQQLSIYCGWLLHRTWGGLAFVAIYFFHAPFPVIIIAAAVVGVVLNLAVWFGLHVILPATESVVDSSALFPLRSPAQAN